MRLLGALSVAPVVASAAECSVGKLRSLLKKQRAHAWACEGGSLGVPVLDDTPWTELVLDDADSFSKLSYKAMRPLPVPSALDTIWSTDAIFKPAAASSPPATARSWVAAHVVPGMAIAIEGVIRLPRLGSIPRQLMQQLGVTGSIDLYATHLPEPLSEEEHGAPVGSYGWHVDTVDALIYVLAGTKRVRIAGYSPGSKVSLDRVLGPRSAVYVPGGCFHHLLALQKAGDGASEGGWDGAWARVLSIGLPNANTDLLHRRVDDFAAALKDQHFSWPDASSPPLPLPAGLGESPPLLYSEADALDPNGLAALHRRTLRGEVEWLQLLVYMGASVDLRTRSDGKRPSRTALALALCCAPQHSIVKLVEVLLSFGAKTAEVEGSGSKVLSARAVALRRGGLPAQLLARLARTAAEL